MIDFFNREDKSSGSSLMSVLVDYTNVAAKGILLYLPAVN
ncbi:hypothetical protein CLOSTMETH_02855 [[Clostridium] methylpentosum DSM 5476]|uniref:Uncharacterized protein n=1 Tax=[Clostridium] methylpentosum DSM 5476 TaxID=537013 RepID=C0EG62_9FIRM|nr:hypothetical protein CLOSTMETH_02855 [[Clostridium] methylpentosum DSM 5476]